MKDLLEAFAIFAKYTDDAHPTCCEHDTLYVLVTPSKVTAADTARLIELSFEPSQSDGHFYSNRFGSA
jgi:hypothetical protein